MKAIKIKDIFSVIRNGANIKQSSDKAGYPITRIETIVDNQIDYSRVGFADVYDEKYSDYYLSNGDILMSHINSVTHLGKVGVVEDLNTKVIHGMNLIVLKSNIEIAFPKYLYRYFITKAFRNKLIPITKKSVNQASFNISDLKEIEIPLPSYADQIRIANILGKIEEVIQARKNAIDQLDELVKATFYDMFGDPVRNEKGWEKKPLNYLGNLDRGVSKHRPRNAPELLGGKYPLVQTGDVTRAGLWLKEYQQTYSELGLKQSKMWPSGTLLITIAANIAQTSILTFDSCFPDSVVGFTPYKGRANAIFIHYLLSFYQESLEKNAPQSAQKNINLGVLRELESIAPDLILQNQFAIIAEKIEKLKEEQEKQLLEMEALYASVSHAAFSGTLDLTRIPYDKRLLPVVEPVNEPEVIDKKKDQRKTDSIEFSFYVISSLIKINFKSYYFNSEMLLNYLHKEENINIPYYTYSEKKKKPELDNDEDFYGFIQSILTGNNPFLNLEQVFYNAEEENIKDICFREIDLEQLAKKEKKERSGIYFRIKNETTTR